MPLLVPLPLMSTRDADRRIRKPSLEMLGWMFLVLWITQVWGTENTGDESLPAHKRQSVQYSTLVGPSFVNTSLHAHAHAPIGQTAYLTCIVNNLHNHTVSWVRVRDIHLLTAGETTYIADKRFVAVNPGGGNEWMLRLHHAKTSDAGAYLCQVSVSPPISTTVTLLVTEAVASVHPGSDVYLKAGSQVELVCEVSGCPYPASPAWYRENLLQDNTEIKEGKVQATPSLPLETSTSKMALEATNPSHQIHSQSRHENIHDPSMTLKYPSAGISKNDLHLNLSGLSRSHWSKSSESFSQTPSIPVTTIPTPIGLPIATATFKRPKVSSALSGVYTCTNFCTDPINLTLHVLTGDEETAAMQHPNASPLLLAGRVWMLGVVHLLNLVFGESFTPFS